MNIKKYYNQRGNLTDWISNEKRIPFFSTRTKEDIEKFGFKPFVFEDKKINSLSKRWTTGYIESEIGHIVIDIYVSVDGTFPGGMGPYDESKYRIVKMLLSDCLKRINGIIDEPIISKGEKYYMYQSPADQFGKTIEQIDMSEYLPTNVESTNFWLSGPGNITPIHYDLSDNFLVQIAGRKKVLIWNPSDYEHLQFNPIGTIHDRQSSVDLTSPNDNVLEIAKVPVSTHELLPGQVLFIPLGWPHFVVTETLSTSVNYWWVADDILRMRKVLDTTNSYERKIAALKDILLDRRPELSGMIDGMLSDGSLANMS